MKSKAQRFMVPGKLSIETKEPSPSISKQISLCGEISQQAFISSGCISATCSRCTKIAFLIMKVPLQLADKFLCQSELLQRKDTS